MRRPIAIFVLAIAGCGQPAVPTPHEKYVAAAAELDRQSDKLTELSASTNKARVYARAMFGVVRQFSTMPFGVPLPAAPATTKVSDRFFGVLLPSISGSRCGAEAIRIG